MSEHCGYVVQINELNPHSNADRLQIATIFGASVIVGLDVKIGDLGVYFPIDLQLSEEYCAQNNLVRKFENLLFEGHDTKDNYNKNSLTHAQQEAVEICAQYVIYSIFYNRENFIEYMMNH